jgi:hypothetical protein
MLRLGEAMLRLGSAEIPDSIGLLRCYARESDFWEGSGGERIAQRLPVFFGSFHSLRLKDFVCQSSTRRSLGHGAQPSELNRG